MLQHRMRSRCPADRRSPPVASTLLLAVAVAGVPGPSSGQVITSCGSPTALTHRQVLLSNSSQDDFGADMALSGDDLALGVGSLAAGAGSWFEDFETLIFIGGALPWDATNDHATLNGSLRVDFSDERLLVSGLQSLSTYLRLENGIYNHEQLHFGAVPGMQIVDVAIDGDFIIASYHYQDGSLPRDGLVKFFEFQRNSTTWSEVASFAAPAGSHWNLGISVDIQEGVAVAGAPGKQSSGSPGRVREYLRIGGTWVDGAEITPDSLITEFDAFGASVALDGIRLAVGAPYLDVGGLPPLTKDVGGAYVFKRTFPFLAWEREAVVVTPTAGTGDEIGWSVELSGTVLAVGAPGAGQASIFSRQGSSWTLCHVLTRPSLATDFGVQVTMGAAGFLASADHYPDGGVGFNRAVFYYPLGIFVDGFESGDTSRWSGALP